MHSMTLSFLHSSLGADRSPLAPWSPLAGTHACRRSHLCRGPHSHRFSPPSSSLHSPGPPLPQAGPLLFLFWARGCSAGCPPPPHLHPPRPALLPFPHLTHTPWQGPAACLHCLVCSAAHRPFPICPQLSCLTAPLPPFPILPMLHPAALCTLPSPAQPHPHEPCGASLLSLGPRRLRNWPHLPGLTRGSGLGYFLLVPSPPSNTLLPSRKVQSSPRRLSHSPPPA